MIIVVCMTITVLFALLWILAYVVLYLRIIEFTIEHRDIPADSLPVYPNHA